MLFQTSHRGAEGEAEEKKPPAQGHMGWRRLEETTLDLRFRTGGGWKLNLFPWRGGREAATVSHALNQTLHPPSRWKMAEFSTKVMRWAEDLRAREMKKEQDPLILPVVFSHVPPAQHRPLRILGEEGGSESKREARRLRTPSGPC